MPRQRTWLLAAFGIVALALALNVFTGGALTSLGHHTWRATLGAPGEDAWDVELPLLHATEPGPRADALDELHERLKVTRGEAHLERNGSRLRVTGAGEVTIEATRAFWGGRSTELREAFVRWTYVDRQVQRFDADAPDLVSITVELDMSGGEGHTCRMRGLDGARLHPGEAGELLPPEGSPSRAMCT